MSRRRLSFKERKRQLKQIDLYHILELRKEKLYNRIYRKSNFFICTWVIRLVFFSSFFVVLYFDDKTTSTHKEVVQTINTESYTSYSRKRQLYEQITVFYIETNVGKYESSIRQGKRLSVIKGDTLTISTNIFGKAVYFTKDNWQFIYGIDGFMLIYYLVFLLPTFISCFMNNGLESFTSKLLWFICLADIFAMIFYFY